MVKNKVMELVSVQFLQHGVVNLSHNCRIDFSFSKNFSHYSYVNVKGNIKICSPVNILGVSVEISKEMRALFLM